MIERLSKRIRRENGQGGFTLIELLVVIVIIGILLAIAVPSYLNFRQRAQDSAAQANVRAALPAVETFFADNSTYVGMDLAALRLIDPSVQIEIVGTPNASSYCIKDGDGAGGDPAPNYYKRGPSGAITSTACTGP